MLTEVISHPDSDEDLFPTDPEANRKLVAELQDWYQEARDAKSGYELRWKRYYKLFRNFVERRKGDWRSKVFIPIVFYTIQTVIPRLVAQLPKMLVHPVGPEDVDGSEKFEDALEWCQQQSGLELQQVASFTDACIYGTGILKTFHARRDVDRVRRFREPVPLTAMISQPVMDPETQGPLMGLDGQPVVEEVEEVYGIGEGPWQTEREKVTLYDGPGAEAIDIFNFWPAPEATTIDDARYVIQRAYKDRRWVKDRIVDGTYRLPEGLDEIEFWQQVEDPATDRLRDIGLDGGGTIEGRRRLEILEIWTDDRCIHMVNQAYVVMVMRNPYQHGRKPYVKIVDQYVPHEFWGMGEVEPLEGIQDATNAQWNQRIDNVKLVMNRMFLVDENALIDRRDIVSRPGGIVRVRNDNGLPLEQVMAPVPIEDVTSSAYQEVFELERLSEKVSGVNAYTGGGSGTTDSPMANQTATGAIVMSEQGNTRFSHKMRLAELSGLNDLALHFGSILQQFMPEDFQMRVWSNDRIDPMTGQPSPGWDFPSLGPEAINGAFDFMVESGSTTQTESMRQERAITLLQLFAQFPNFDINKLAEDVLRAFGIRNPDDYILPPQPMGMVPGMNPQMAAGPLQGLPPEQVPPEMAAQMPPEMAGQVPVG